MIKLTLDHGQPVLVNVFNIRDMRTEEHSNGNVTVIDGEIYVRESLDEIQEIIITSCVSMLRAISNAC